MFFRGRYPAAAAAALWLCCRLTAAAYGDLTEASAGRMLVRKVSWQDYELWVFVRPAEAGRWECREFTSGRTTILDPRQLTALPFAASGDEFAVGIYVSHSLLTATNDPCRAVAAKFSIPVIDRIRQFLEAEQEQWRQFRRLHAEEQRQIRRLRAEEQEDRARKDRPSCQSCRPRAEEQDDLAPKVADTVKDGEPKHIIEMTATDKDYYTAVLLYRHYLGQLEKSLKWRESSYYRETRDILDTLGREILRNYCLEREASRQLEQDFAKLCPNQNGRWKYALPVNMRELYQLADLVPEALRRSRQLSPECDFPEWGNEILNVLAMKPNHDGAEELRTKFREAMASYKELFQDQGNK